MEYVKLQAMERVTVCKYIRDADDHQNKESTFSIRTTHFYSKDLSYWNSWLSTVNYKMLGKY